MTDDLIYLYGRTCNRIAVNIVHLAGESGRVFGSRRGRRLRRARNEARGEVKRNHRDYGDGGQRRQYSSRATSAFVNRRIRIVAVLNLMAAGIEVALREERLSL